MDLIIFCHQRSVLMKATYAARTSATKNEARRWKMMHRATSVATDAVSGVSAIPFVCVFFLFGHYGVFYIEVITLFVMW